VTRRTIDELGDLLERPYCAVLATHWPDGSVLLSPVWHEWRDGGFNVGVPSGDVKARHLARDPRATIVVFDHSWPGRGFEVRGIARISEFDRTGVSRRLSIRYLQTGSDPDSSSASSPARRGHGISSTSRRLMRTSLSSRPGTGRRHGTADPARQRPSGRPQRSEE